MNMTNIANELCYKIKMKITAGIYCSDSYEEHGPHLPVGDPTGIMGKNCKNK